MNLWCSQHGTNHRLTAGQVERVVYALSCEVASALTEPDGDRVHAGEDGFSRIPCPVEFLDLSRSGEGYGETTESMVDARRATERHGGAR